MQDTNSWEVVVSSLISQLISQHKNIEAQQSSLNKYLQQHSDKAKLELLNAQLRSMEVSFNRMEDKLQDMIIYLCKAMTVSKLHKLSNLLEEVDHRMEF